MSLHEKREDLKKETLDMKRAIDSLKEELEAIDWYNQRADACQDNNLRKILLHNAEEEKEHAIMLLEWMRRHDSEIDNNISKYIGTEAGDITKLEN